MRARVLVAFAFVATTAAPAALAHVEPRDAEQRLTAEIDAAGEHVDGRRLLQRAMAYRDEGELPEAEADLERAEHASPPGDRGLIAVERARIAFDRARDEDAVMAYDEALRIERPDGLLAPRRVYAVALAERAATQERLARWDAARDDWSAAFDAHPSAEAALARGRLDELRGDLDRAVAGYREGMAETPSIVLARSLSRALLAQGDAAEVVALADDAIEATPFDVEWRLLRAEALSLAGSKDEAEDDRASALVKIEQAMSTRPTDLRRLVRARVWLALGRAEDAAREAEAIARRRPSLIEASSLAREARAEARAERPGGRPEGLRDLRAAHRAPHEPVQRDPGEGAR